MEIIFVLKNNCFEVCFFFKKFHFSSQNDEKNHLVWNWSVLWLCINNFFAQVRKSKEDGPDPDKLLEKAKSFFLSVITSICTVPFRFSFQFSLQELNLKIL